MSWVDSIRHDALTPLFLGLTALGSGTFLFLLLGIGYWSASKRVFARIGVLLALAIVAQACLKVLFVDPRPDPALHLVSARGFGFPSGHSWISVVLWGYLAWEIRRTWAWIFFPLLTLGVCFSRIYLGVHDPEDVLGGAGFGLLTLVAFLLGARWVGVRWPRLSLPWQLGIVAVVQLVLIAVIVVLAHTHSVPRYADSGAALLGGLTVGMLLEQRLGDFAHHPAPGRRIASVAIGVTGMLLLGFGLRPLLLWMGLGEPVTRYGISLLLGLWIALVAPLIFVRARLAGGPGESATPSG